MTATYVPHATRMSRDETRLLVTCWCESFTFRVPVDWVREGRAPSCGRGGCQGELVEGRLPRRGRRDVAAHGTRTRYVKGCRCDECRAVESDYQRARHLRRKVES